MSVRINLNSSKTHAGGHKIQPNEDGMSMAAALRAKLDAIHAQHVTAEIGQVRVHCPGTCHTWKLHSYRTI